MGVPSRKGEKRGWSRAEGGHNAAPMISTLTLTLSRNGAGEGLVPELLAFEFCGTLLHEGFGAFKVILAGQHQMLAVALIVVEILQVQIETDS